MEQIIHNFNNNLITVDQFIIGLQKLGLNEKEIFTVYAERCSGHAQ